MSTILVTGASGFVGRALATDLAPDHDVVCFSRRDPGLEKTRYIRGDFAQFEDLRQLDDTRIDAVVHLAAVTGGCLERDGILVNCEGTRVLMRYLIDRGCRRFVMASSTAVVGFQAPGFRPTTVPIPDDHPCLDRHGYGFSKHMMEQVTHYYGRQHPDIDVVNLRLSSIAPDDSTPAGMRPLGNWAVGSITVMVISDAVRLLRTAAEAQPVPGVHTYNATCAEAWTTVPTAQLLEHWWGDDVDLSPFRTPGHEVDSVYDVTRLTERYGFDASSTREILARSRGTTD